MKFEKIEAGTTLYDVHRHKMGNTAVSTVGVWRVRVVEIDYEKRIALCSWNGNKPDLWSERRLAKLRQKPPLLIHGASGVARLATRAEIAAMSRRPNDPEQAQESATPSRPDVKSVAEEHDKPAQEGKQP